MKYFSSFVFTIVVILSCTGRIAHAGGGISIDPILADGMWNNPTSMQITDAGVIHLAWMKQFSTDSSTKEIWYGRLDPGQPWVFTQITSNAVREEFPCLTLDASGNVHIAFHTGSGSSNLIRYVNNVGAARGSFNPIVNITTTPYVITEIRVDSTDTVHFVFRSQFSPGAQEVYYTTWTSGGGVGALVNVSSSPVEEDASPQLALDSNDNVHIVWQRGNALGGPLKYVNNIGGSFQEITTGVGGNVIESWIVIDDNDRVSLFYRPDFDSLMVIDDAAGRGTFSTPTPVYTGTYRSAFIERIAVDSQGHRYVAFASNIAANRGVFLVRETDLGWETPEFIADAPLTNLGTSIGINSTGKLAVTYSLGSFDTVVMADLYLACVDIDLGDCPADLTDSGATNQPDGVVDVFDLLLLIANWATNGTGANIADPPNDLVDVFDLLDLLAAWGACP